MAIPPPPPPPPPPSPPASPSPAHWRHGAVPAHPLYGAPLSAPPAGQQPAWDQAALIQALNAMSMQQGQAPPYSGGDWYLDSGATSHMASSSGSKNEGGDPPL
ncbi:WAS/WASL-interacting protein family member 3-like [Triticum aestivum]|uniref:WAS/WASL-interacting protein family member 3-like n=1 Tax=Triticum aestivum TaxID=4565 RepID=UPI001D034A15|nr:WAS/WASL-interacting protein family member 3-like [Triticum aestivum]